MRLIQNEKKKRIQRYNKKWDRYKNFDRKYIIYPPSFYCINPIIYPYFYKLTRNK